MTGRIQPCLLQSILYERLVRQCLKRRAGFGYQYEQRMCYVDTVQHACCVIRIHIADKTCFHITAAVFPGPVVQRDIHSARTEIAAADTDLYDGRKLLSGSIGDLAVMHTVREIGSLLLLSDVEIAFIDTVCKNVLAELSACELVQHQAFFAGIYDLSVVERFVFFSELCFLRESAQCVKHFVVDFLGGKVVCQSV